jgi:hypothetical protein
MRMTQSEYRANLNGLNIFFGAVLGVVMAGTESLAPFDFGLVLFIVATLVICILYVSASPYRLAYAAAAAALIAGLPWLLELFVDPGQRVPHAIQPTLAVWLGVTLLIEFLPREAGATPPEA